ncbi:MAG TPA: type III pantothenate kinase [Bacillales bacterium]|nr:type III pantothenate kinase [Bacillales bacterium]
MIFVFDVGNTNTMLGVYEGDRLIHHWRINTSWSKTEDEYAMIVKSLFAHVHLTFSDISGIAISSVVPSIMFSLERMCEKYFHTTPMIIGPGVKTGLDIKSDNPKEIGADRIVNAVAGIHLYGSPLVIVDFGTATTYCYINEKGQYAGGAIAPGINISTESLIAHASKLPRIEIAKPPSIVGRNTVSAMQSGVLYGYVGQVEGIVTRMKEQAKQQPVVIATGGLAPLIAGETAVIDHLEPFLTLKGLQIIYLRNQQERR